jgi:signal transduction histidine kinase
MQERARLAGGWWKIASAPGEGTTVEFWVPTNHPDPAPDRP